MARRRGQASDPPGNAFYCGDNLDVLRLHIEDSSVDLVYLDPPFQSGRDYNLLFAHQDGSRAPAQQKAFEDTWEWDQTASVTYDEILASGSRGCLALESLFRVLGPSRMMAYMSMMTIRLVELHRVLKETGSLYLHCDPTASPYLRVVLDAIFEAENFRGEIVWQRSRAHNDRTIRRYGAVHDTLLFYSKSDRWSFVPQFTERDKDAPKTHDLYTHSDGKLYRKGDCRAPGDRGPKYTWNGHTQHWRFSTEERDRLIKEGRIVYSKSGMPRVLRPVDPNRGSPLQDVWTDIDPPNSGSREALGYPTQKPVKLLERIIGSSCPPGGVVLDPFCGCGTTIHAAQRLNRRWVGIDITHVAVDLIRRRLEEEFGAAVLDTFQLKFEPRDLESARQLALANRFEFEQWALAQLNAQDDHSRGADHGIDGVITFREGVGLPIRKIVVSVKSGKPSVTHLRDLGGVLKREGASIGVLVTLTPPTRAMRREASSGGFYSIRRGEAIERHPCLQLLTVEDLLAGEGIDAPVPPPRRGPKRALPKQREFKFEEDHGESPVATMQRRRAS